MILWIDAQLSPYIAEWISSNFKIEVKAIRDIGLRDANDNDIFNKARLADAIVLTKDIDFKILQDRFGSPPKIIWLTCGNTSNKRMKEILSANLEKSLSLLESGELIVEISGE